MPSFAQSTLIAFWALCLGAIGPAQAQTASPAVPPTPSCEKPGDPPRLTSTEAGREQAERKRNEWANKTKTYVECLKRFIDDEQALVGPHVKAINAALEEYQQAIKSYNEQAQATRQ